MNAQLKQAKQQIRPYLRQISETALWQLCAMAKDGKVEFTDPCKCIRGIVGGGTRDGFHDERSIVAIVAEWGLAMLGGCDLSEFDEMAPYLRYPIVRKLSNHYRNLRLLPMCRAEMRRRSRVAQVEKEEIGV
jgi:hypothetical protein